MSCPVLSCRIKGEMGMDGAKTGTGKGVDGAMGYLNITLLSTGRAVHTPRFCGRAAAGGRGQQGVRSPQPPRRDSSKPAGTQPVS